MKNPNTIANRSRTALRPLTALAALGVLVAGLGASNFDAAQAAPRYRNQRQDDWQNRAQTVYGIVQNDRRGNDRNDRFSVRLEDGRVVKVITRGFEPRRLSRGDSVRLTGFFDRNTFIANNVNIERNVGGWNGNGNGNGHSQNNWGRTLRGRVTSDSSGRDFWLTTDEGRTLLVRSIRPEPYRLSRRDRVEVSGSYDGNIFIARNVNILRDR